MAKRDADRNLLFGILALQMDFVGRDALIDAMGAWALEKSRPLGEILVERAGLGCEDRDLIEAMVRRHVARHGDDPEKSLAAVAPAVLAELAGDPAVAATLAGDFGLLPTHGARPGGPERTTAGPPRGAAGDGDGDATVAYTPRVGRFRVLRPHAKGGIGVVSVALDDELHREVALKEIQPELADDPTSRARFLLEAEITGRLEHPGVVPVYSLGVDAKGRPYYTMRFIRGDSLKDAIDRFHADADGRDPGERSVALRKLLGSFLDVCNAVAYSHSRGVLHRDIKPANILLGPYGETLVVDWGLAKVVGRDEPGPEPGVSVEATLRPSSGSGSKETLPGSAIGTPGYMSPEQAGGRIESLTAATDIYGLGATLYFLLTGRPPFEGGSVAEILERVRRGDFPRPRQANRRVSPALEAVCLKAMAFDPSARYASARALAGDVEHWLADEPVSAWREPWAVRARRRAARHKTLAIAAAAALVVGVVGLSAALAIQAEGKSKLAAANGELSRANDRLGESNAKLADANAQLLAANAREAEVRRLAQGRADLAVRAIGTFAHVVGRDAMLQQPQFDELRRSLLAPPLEFYKKLRATLEGSRESDRATRAQLADAYRGLADLNALLGSKDDAIRAIGEAVDMLRALAKERPDEPEHRRQLAAAITRLGNQLSQIGRRAEGVALIEEAVAILDALAREQPGNLDDRAELAQTLHYLGMRRWLFGQPASPDYERAASLYRDLLRDRPGDPACREGLARVYNSEAVVRRVVNQPDRAIELCGQSIALWDGLLKERPASPDYKAGLAKALNSLGVAEDVVNRNGRGIANLERSRDLHDELARAYPAVRTYREELARNNNNLGRIYGVLGRGGDSARAYERAREIYDALAREDPSVITYKAELVVALEHLATIDEKAGRVASARARIVAALPIADDLATGPGTNTFYRNQHTLDLFRLARYQRAEGDDGEALGTFERLRAFCERTAARETAADWKLAAVYNLACAYALSSELLASGRLGAGRAAEARPLADRAMATLRRAVDLGFRNARHIASDDDLQSLRDRPDFRALLRDAEFPVNPFKP